MSGLSGAEREALRDTIGWAPDRIPDDEVFAAVESILAARAEQIAQQIEARIAAEPVLMHVVDWREGMEEAARIARSQT